MNGIVEESTGKGGVAWWHWHRRLYSWVTHWADTRYGVVALILLAVTEPICVPIPADVMVLGMGLSKPRRAVHYSLICALFSVMGGSIAFGLGVAIGQERVIGLFGLLSLGPRVEQAFELYRAYSFWAIAISSLTPVPYMMFSWLGGMAEGVSITQFVLVSLVFRTMRFGSEGLLLYLFGEKARSLIEKYFNLATVVVILLLILVAYVMKSLGGRFGG
jgi:membrane protein YqaA with SNARE-associated domain